MNAVLNELRIHAQATFKRASTLVVAQREWLKWRDAEYDAALAAPYSDLASALRKELETTEARRKDLEAQLLLSDPNWKPRNPLINPEEGYSFFYPDGYKVEAGKKGLSLIAIRSKTDHTVTAVFRTIPKTEKPPSGWMYSGGFETLQKRVQGDYPDAKITASEKSQAAFGGRPAWTQTLSVAADVPTTVQQYFVETDDKFVLLETTVPDSLKDKYEGDFLIVERTFQIEK
jgi:hypothetical protein